MKMNKVSLDLRLFETRIIPSKYLGINIFEPPKGILTWKYQNIQMYSGEEQKMFFF